MNSNCTLSGISAIKWTGDNIHDIIDSGILNMENAALWWSYNAEYNELRLYDYDRKSDGTPVIKVKQACVGDYIYTGTDGNPKCINGSYIKQL